MIKSFTDERYGLEKMAITDEPFNTRDKPDPKIDEAWINEAVARREAYLRGEAKLIPAEEVFEKFK